MYGLSDLQTMKMRLLCWQGYGGKHFQGGIYLVGNKSDLGEAYAKEGEEFA